MDQATAPLYDGLRAYLERELVGFHTPGHTGGRAIDLADLPRLDLTEVPLWPGGPLTPILIRRAEALAAELFGAAHSYFLTNGASAGVMAMLLAACPPGSTFAVSRDCHRSVVNACIIGDLRPEFLPPLTAPAWPFPLGVEPETITRILASGTPILLTNPTYHGVVWDLRPLASSAGTLLVDEAHGTHLALAEEPRGAKPAGAKAWVHGCHKTLGSLTQTGLLHLGAGVAPELYCCWLERLASTSPSYPLLASLDLARQWAARQGREAWHRAGGRLGDLRQRLMGAGLRVLSKAGLPDGAGVDPAKLTIVVPGDGPTTARFLQDLHGLQVEAVGPDWLTFLVTPFHTEIELERLGFALLAVVDPLVPRGDRLSLPWPAQLPQRAIWPHEAGIRPRRRLPLVEAEGSIAAEPLCPYPPGIPLLWPGEILDASLVAYVQCLTAAGVAVSGIDSAATVAVVTGD